MTLKLVNSFMNATPIYDAALILLRELVNLKKENECFSFNHKDNFKDRPKAFLKEWCTIRIGSHRRAGHSTAMMQLAIEQLSCQNSSVCLVFYSHKMEKRCTSEWRNSLTNGKGKCVVTTVNSLCHCRIPCETFDLVLVDCASLFSKTQMDKLYDCLTPSVTSDKSPIIILFE